MGCCQKTAGSRCALVGWSISSVLFLALSVILLTVCFIGQNSKPPSPCHGAWGVPPNVYLHRGNLSLAQEHSAEAIVPGISASTGNPAWPEMDVLASREGTPHFFHDRNALRMTGVDRSFADIADAELADGTIANQAVIDGYNYSQTALVPTAESVIRSICSLNPKAPMDLDIKDSASAIKTRDILSRSGCADIGKSSSNIIFAVGDPTIGRDCHANEGPKDPIRISLFLHPNSYGSLGLYFFLKTRFLHWYAGADMISAHYTVWDKDYDLIRQYEEDGYCSAVYGIPNSEETIARYPSASYYVVDEGPYFPANLNGQFGGDGSEEEIVYDGSRSGYAGMVTVGFLSLFACLISLVMVYRNRSYCCYGTCAKNKGLGQDEDKNIHDCEEVDTKV